MLSLDKGLLQQRYQIILFISLSLCVLLQKVMIITVTPVILSADVALPWSADVDEAMDLHVHAVMN